MPIIVLFLIFLLSVVLCSAISAAIFSESKNKKTASFFIFLVMIIPSILLSNIICYFALSEKVVLFEDDLEVVMIPVSHKDYIVNKYCLFYHYEGRLQEYEFGGEPQFKKYKFIISRNEWSYVQEISKEIKLIPIIGKE